MRLLTDNMEWYKTCKHCNETASYGQFKCGCIEKYQATLREKVSNAKLLISYTYGSFPWVFEYKKYTNNDEIFYTRTCIKNGIGEYHIFDDFEECSQLKWDIMILFRT